MRLSIEMGSSFQRTVAELGAMGSDIATACNRGLSHGVKVAAANVSQKHLSGQDLKSRTGNLRRAVDAWMAAPLDGVVGVRENSAVDSYKWLLGDETKTIKPKNSKFLAIPIGEGLTGAGVPRYSSPRDVPESKKPFFFTSDAGNLLMGFKRGKTKRAKVYPLFVFKKQVTIEGTGALAKGVLESADEIADIMTDEIGRELD